jgi:transcriptional regulator with GAF, ATPase, and Fis domain
MSDLAEELRRKTEEVRILREVSTRINATLVLDRIYDIVLHTMHDLFGFGHALILVADDPPATLRVVAGRGYDDPAVGATVPVGVGVIGTVAQRKKMMRVGNLGRQRAYVEAIRRQVEASPAAEQPGDAVRLPGLPNAESQVAIPLLIEDRLIGVLFVESVERHVFEEQDETLIAIVANLCASAIHNARLYRREQERRESLEGTVAERTRELQRTSRELSVVRELRAQEARRYDFNDIVGTSRAIQETRRLLRKIVTSPASTILVTGENGTGKDLVAKVVHFQSSRAAAPFMNITCSALAPALLESELFGHERGAFTDAHRRKKGLLELADGGTVFLDEIGEMGLPLQTKLLRFLEEKAFKRVGGAEDIRVDVRIVAATNRDLEAMVRQGTFREDLYYRLRVLFVELPPLRDRTGDIGPLVQLFLRQFQREFNKPVEGLAPDALTVLEGYSWPGNVRELRNAVERAVLLAEGPLLRADDFSALAPRGQGTGTVQLPCAGLDFEELERGLVIQALERAGWNKAGAARLLGMPRDWLRYRIAKFGLRGSDE